MTESVVGVRPHLLEITGDTLAFNERINAWKDAHCIKFILAFSGGADDDQPALRYLRARLTDADMSDVDRATALSLVNAANDEIVAGIVRDVLMPLRDYRVAVQTGGTQYGVPRVATQVAKELGFRTVGVFPLLALTKRQVLGADMLDLAVCVNPFVGESCWGDESAIFTKLLDAVIVIGGGAGTMVEVAHLLKLNERRGADTKHIVPIHGTHGTAAAVPSFPGKSETMSRCTPRHSITSGKAAYEYLVQHAFIDDVYEPREGENA